jgi:hypothetical protein
MYNCFLSLNDMAVLVPLIQKKHDKIDLNDSNICHDSVLPVLVGWRPD